MSFYVVLSLIILCCSLVIMQAALPIFKVQRLTIPGFFYFSYLIFVFFPAIFVALEKPAPYNEAYFISVTSILLTVPLGICLANYLFRFKRAEVKVFYDKPIRESHPSFSFRLVFILMLVGLLSIILLYLSQVEILPLFEIIKNPGAYLASYEAREASFKLLDTPLRYLYFLVRVLIFPFMTTLALGYYLHTHRRIWSIYFILLLIAGTFYAALSLAKWPVVVIFFMLLLFMYVYRQGRVGTVLTFSLLGLMLAFPLFVILIITTRMDVGIPDALKAIAVRTFYDPAESLYDYFEIFPMIVDYLHGKSIGKLSWLMGWEYFDVPNYVFQYRFPRGLVSGSANTGFIGGLHADFGITGVLIGGFCVGILMEVLQIGILRRKKTILSLTVYAFLIFEFFLLHFSALHVVMISNGLLLLLLLPWGIIMLEKFLENSIKSNFIVYS